MKSQRSGLYDTSSFMIISRINWDTKLAIEIKENGFDNTDFIWKQEGMKFKNNLENIFFFKLRNFPRFSFLKYLWDKSQNFKLLMFSPSKFHIYKLSNFLVGVFFSSSSFRKFQITGNLKIWGFLFQQFFAFPNSEISKIHSRGFLRLILKYLSFF